MTNTRQTKSRPKKHRSEHKPKSNRSQGHSSSSGSSRNVSLSFLFVVNELIVNHDEHNGGVRVRNDDWWNITPPIRAQGYSHEIPSKVMRWRDGAVSEARNWQWGRPATQPGQPKADGLLWTPQPDGTAYYADLYKRFTVFSCSPFLPVVVADGDPSAHDNTRMTPLLFFRPPRDNRMRGTSQAVTDESEMDAGPGPAKYTAGRHPSWIPSLVPPTYATQEHSAPKSAGLGGELPIVIGLMAFSEAGDRANLTNRTDEIFLGSPGHHGRWHDLRWTHNHRPTGCKSTRWPLCV